MSVRAPRPMKRPSNVHLPTWAWIVLAVLTALVLLPVGIGLYLWWWVRSLGYFGVLWFLPRVGMLLLAAGLLTACRAAPPRYLCQGAVLERSGEPIVLCVPLPPP